MNDTDNRPSQAVINTAKENYNESHQDGFSTKMMSHNWTLLNYASWKRIMGLFG